MSLEDSIVKDVIRSIVTNHTASDPVSMHDLSMQVYHRTGSRCGTRRVQSVVKSLIEDEHMPIGSGCTKGLSGYYIIHDAEEGRIASEHLRSRAMSLMKRAAILSRCTYTEVAEQVTMDFMREEARDETKAPPLPEA